MPRRTRRDRPGRRSRTDRFAIRWWPAAALSAAVLLVALALPFLPYGTDLYVHVLWPWQVMRTGAAATLPVWLPDLNAGFGSPGIRLYSPLGPAAAGALGLLLGTAGRGVRAALAMAVGATLAWWAPEPRWRRWSVASVALVSPALLTELVGRFPVSELLAVPIAWRLLEDALRDRWRWRAMGLMTAAVWLVHAPTALMTGLVLTAIAVTSERRWTALRTLAAGGAAGAGCAAWHWLPLFATMSRWGSRAELAEAELSPTANLIGLPDAHLMSINIAMGWAAAGLAAGVLTSGAWRSRRGVIALLLVAVSAWPFEPLWRFATPLGWIQFPWRLLVPATLVGVVAVFHATVGHGWRRGTALALVLAPVALMPGLRLVHEPGLTAAMDWRTAGRRVAASFSGNPLLVDATQNRPPWWGEFGNTLHNMGIRPARLRTPGALKVIAREPLIQSFQVSTPDPNRVTIRLLYSAGWAASVDGRTVPAWRDGAALAVSVPPGRHTLTVRWRGDPLSRVGLATAAATLLLMGTSARRRRADVAAR